MIRVVLADANVLYSRVLRDYLLYAATEGCISIRWSRAILDEVIEHLTKNRPGFDAEAGERLRNAMNGAFPEAEVELDPDADAALVGLRLPDEDDRHVLAAALAVGADVVCTDNVKDFPAEVMDEIGICRMPADTLLSLLLSELPGQMLAAHRLTVSRLPGATDDSTIAALRRAGAPNTADGVAGLIGL